MGGDHELRGHHLRDRHEVLVHVERQRAVERRADRQAVGGEQDGVAVGRRLGERIGREIAAGAGAVLHHHRLVELLAELVAEEPGDGIDGAAGRERHDDADGPVGIGLGQRVAGRKRQGRQRDRKRNTAPVHCILPGRAGYARLTPGLRVLEVHSIDVTPDRNPAGGAGLRRPVRVSALNGPGSGSRADGQGPAAHRSRTPDVRRGTSARCGCP